MATRPGFQPPYQALTMMATAEDHQAAFDHVGEQECRNQGKNNAENGDAVSEDRGPSRRDVAFAKKGELRSHEKNLIPRMGSRELRECICRRAN